MGGFYFSARPNPKPNQEVNRGVNSASSDFEEACITRAKRPRGATISALVLPSEPSIMMVLSFAVLRTSIFTKITLRALLVRGRPFHHGVAYIYSECCVKSLKSGFYLGGAPRIGRASFRVGGVFT